MAARSRSVTRSDAPVPESSAPWSTRCSDARRANGGRTTASRRSASAWDRERRRSSNGSASDAGRHAIESGVLLDRLRVRRDARLEEFLQGCERSIPVTAPVSRDRHGGSMHEMDERLGAFRAELVCHARLDRSSVLGDWPHERKRAGAVDRRDGSLDAAVRETPLVPAAQFGLDPRIVRPPLSELRRIQDGLEDARDRGANRDLCVGEEDASRGRRFRGARGGAGGGHALGLETQSVYNVGGAILSERILAPGADEAAGPLALHAEAAEEARSGRRVKAVAGGEGPLPPGGAPW